MTAPLWTIEEIVKATGGTENGNASQPVTGISIDTRTLEPGELFVPLSDKRDGHDFVGQAFERGAAAALVRQDFDVDGRTQTLIRVQDPLRALEDLARAARARLPAETVVIAVTGSVGKTGTKDMLRACFSALGETHAAIKSFNNHWGVPLTLARTPRHVAAAIYEIGMNHAGEISPLSKLVRPDIAIVTTVEPVHLEFFESVAGIADAKAEIFDGLGEDGIAILNADNPYFDQLVDRAGARSAKVVSFATETDADVRMTSYEPTPTGASVAARVGGREIEYALSIPGKHVAQNSLAVVAALSKSGRDVQRGVDALAGLQPSVGRGSRDAITIPGGTLLVIDESYNANPASMKAALGVLGSMPKDTYARRVAILGDMLELGDDSDALHVGLADSIKSFGIDIVFAAGPHMRSLFDAIPADRQGGWAMQSEDLADEVVRALRPGDAVMIKGSLGSRMAHVLAAIHKHFGSKR